MQTFQVVPEICMLATVDEFLKEFAPTDKDLIFASTGTQKRHLAGKLGNATVIDYRAYGQGEPTDLMVEGIVKALGGKSYDRVFAIGGGTILDVAKLFALEELSPVTDLYQKKFPAKKAHKLILVPTTCGTGSEVTNISILELTKLGTKMGLADAALYADQAVLVPELLKGLPDRVFGASAIDALIHSVESFTSPKSTPFSRTFSLKAMDAIIEGFLAIQKDGLAAREARLDTFLLASTFAGIAFGNAGCAAVHALSYPLGAAQHVPHGEANAVMFAAVYEAYKAKRYDGRLEELALHLANLLRTTEDEAFPKLMTLLDDILPKKPLTDYGVKEEDLKDYTDIVMTKQGRLMANNYVELTESDVLGIYEKLYAQG